MRGDEVRAGPSRAVRTQDFLLCVMGTSARLRAGEEYNQDHPAADGDQLGDSLKATHDGVLDYDSIKLNVLRSG